MNWLRKLTGLSRREQLRRDLEEEIRTHLAMKSADQGDAPAAHRQFGNATLHLEDARAAWGWPRLEAWARDLRFGLRMMARRPAFAATIVVTLALGIGASSTVFSLVDAVLLRPLPYPQSDRLMRANEVRSNSGAIARVSPGTLEDWHRSNRSFESLSGHYTAEPTDTTGAEPERLSTSLIAPRFFETLRVAPALGRTFTPQEEQFGGPFAAIISDAFWQRRFSANPSAVGRTLNLSGQRAVIIGVMPAAFDYPSPTTDVWMPAKLQANVNQIREARFYFALGRLRPGVTPEQAQSDLVSLHAKIAEQYPKSVAGWTATVVPLKDRVVGTVRGVLWLLLAAVGVLLLIACINVACLLLGQFNTRAAEIATRRALGASRAALARQLFAEGLGYSLTGGALGMAASFTGAEFLRRSLPDVPRITELAVDLRVLAFAIAVSVGAAVLFSLAPILQTFRRDPEAELIRRGTGVIGRGLLLPRLLVAGQLALAMVLMIGAGLFLQSLLRLEETPLGFRTSNILTLRVSGTYAEAPGALAQRHQRIMDAIATVPGVDSVAMSNAVPGAAVLMPSSFDIVGGPAQSEGAKRFAPSRVVTSEYFAALDIPIVAGETCRMRTADTDPFELLVNRSFGARFLAGRNPIGHAIKDSESMRIVGVVDDVREAGYASAPEPLMYQCGYLRFWPDSDIIIRTRANPSAAAASIRAAIRTIEPQRAIYSVRTLPEVLDGTLAQNRFRTFLVAVFSGLALLLAAIGLYGVMAYMVAQRTREIGIRVALGARPQQVLAQILNSASAITAIGAAAGLALALAASRWIQSFLHNVTPSDPGTYAVATAALLFVALTACALPARRAASIDPARTLREQ